MYNKTWVICNFNWDGPDPDWCDKATTILIAESENNINKVVQSSQNYLGVSLSPSELISMDINDHVDIGNGWNLHCKLLVCESDCVREERARAAYAYFNKDEGC